MRQAKPVLVRQTGISLLEVLITIVLFSIGILGMVGMLTSSVRAANDARYRSEAVFIASGMIADMWSTTPERLPVEFGPGGTKLASWQNRAAKLLPSAAGKPPTVDLSQPGLSMQSRAAVVTVYWQLPGSSELHSHVVSAQIGKNL